MFGTYFNRRWPVVLSLAAVTLRAVPVSAQDVLSDAGTRERLQVVQQMLDKGKPNAERWWAGWLIGYSAATLAQGVIGLTSDDRKVRQDMTVGAATTLLGAVGQIITPLAACSAPGRLSAIPETTPTERAAKLSEAEGMLRDAAVGEKAGRSWKMHAITGAVNLGSGLIVWLGFKRSLGEGLLNFAINTAVTEIQIWTQPTRAIRDWERYQATYPSQSGTAEQGPGIRWSFMIQPGGAGIRVNF